MEHPIACTLGRADLGAQGERWGQLAATTRVEGTDLPDGLRLVFDRAPGVEPELAALVEIERECCAFADWTLSVDPDHVVLDITAEGDAIPVVQAVFTALRSPGSSCC
jgi:hypothetical protein